MSKNNLSEKIVKSNFIQKAHEGKDLIIWHSLFGNPKVVSSDIVELLNFFSVPRTMKSAINKYEIDDDGIKIMEDLLTDYYLIPKNLDERNLLKSCTQKHVEKIINGSLVDYLELIMSEACNFRCTYCIHFNNLETTNRLSGTKKTMTFATAKEAVDKYLLTLRQNSKKKAIINFGGGEPLLAWSTIEKTVDYCKQSYAEEFDFHFSINTNASLITVPIAKMLRDNHIEIATSLDGPREGNDRVRKSKEGLGTFDNIMAGLDILKQVGYPITGVAITVNEKNFPNIDKDFIDWLADRGMNEIRIDIDVIGMVEIPIDDLTIKLLNIYQYAKNKKIDVTGFWTRPAEFFNKTVLNDVVAFCGAVRGNSLCINPSGLIYSCGYSTTQLGKMSEWDKLFNSNQEYYRLITSRLAGENKKCYGCSIEGQCGGGCLITQEFVHMMKTSKIDRMCEFYRHITPKLLLLQIRE